MPFFFRLRITASVQRHYNLLVVHDTVYRRRKGPRIGLTCHAPARHLQTVVESEV